MANKVVYNNTSYDILDAITLVKRDYLILLDNSKLDNIIYLEKVSVNDKLQYLLPPKTFDVTSNPNYDLKRLQVNFVVYKIVDILKTEVNNGILKSDFDIKDKFNQIKNFIYTDLTIKSILDDQNNLNLENFDKISLYLDKYLNTQFVTTINVEDKKQYNYLDRPIKTSEGLDYEWLYNLSLDELKELASSKNRTSEELIYILDALDKRRENDQVIDGYVEMGRALSLKKNDNKAAFIDTFLLAIITASFALLILLGIF